MQGLISLNLYICVLFTILVSSPICLIRVLSTILVSPLSSVDVILSHRYLSKKVLLLFFFSHIYVALLDVIGDRKDQKTLERLRAERQEKIDELKEKTNYYTTQQLIQVIIKNVLWLFSCICCNSACVCILLWLCYNVHLLLLLIC